jgi:hypothetical protein
MIQELFLMLRFICFVAVTVWAIMFGQAARAEGVPPAPKLTSLATSVQPFPRFYWERLPGTLDIKAPLQYEIEIAADAAFGKIVDRDKVNLARYVPDAPLAPGEYFWRVRARVDANGAPGPYSVAGEFRVAACDVELKPTLPTQGDALPALKKAVAEAQALARQGKSVRITLAPGEYSLVPNTPTDKACVQFSEVNNIILDCGGASFAIKRWGVAFVNITRGNNIAVMNATVDYDEELPFTQARVAAVDAATGVVTVKIEPGYPEFDAAHFARSDGFAILLDPQVPGRMKAGAPIHFMFDKAKYKKTGDHLWAMPLKNAAQVKSFAVGDRFISFSRSGGGESLCGGTEARNVSYYKITSYATGGGGHYVNIHGDEMAVLHCRELIKPGRWFGGNADGVHAKGHVIGPWIEGLEVDGIGDDAIAFYTRPAKIAAAHVGGDKRVFSLFDESFNLEPGNEVVFFNPRRGVYFAEAKVVSIKPDGANHRVTFDRDLPLPEKIGPDLKETDQIWNRGKTCGDFMIRGCEIRNVRRFGAVFRALRGVVEDNSFTATSSSGILFLNEPPYPNGPMTSDVLIQRNKLTGNCRDSSMPLGSIALALRKLMYAPAEGQGPYNILIRDNVITDWNKHAIQLYGTRQVTVENNTITATPGAKFIHEDNVAIKVQNSKDIIVRGNRIEDQRAGYQPFVQTDSTVTGDVK